MRVRILGRYWRIEWCDRCEIGDDLGACEKPEYSDRTIYFANKQPPRTLLETAIHEALHAAKWDLPHKWVETTAADIARLLWRLGYRRR